MVSVPGQQYTFLHDLQVLMCRAAAVGGGGEFPGGPVVKTLHFNVGGAGLIPGLGTKIPHALQSNNQNVKHKAIL